MKQTPIFSGDASRPLWKQINSAKTKPELRRAIYAVCVAMQNLEERLAKAATGATKSTCPSCGKQHDTTNVDCGQKPQPIGWVCPVCRQVWSPSVLRCDCLSHWLAPMEIQTLQAKAATK